MATAQLAGLSQTRNLPTCNEMPQPTAPQCAPHHWRIFKESLSVAHEGILTHVNNTVPASTSCRAANW